MDLLEPGAGNTPLTGRFQQLCGYLTQEGTSALRHTHTCPHTERQTQRHTDTASNSQTTDGREPMDLLEPGAGNTPLTGRFQQLCGYVTQEDTFVPNLTVRETLQFAQALRRNSQGNIEQIMAILNLTKVADTIVGNPLKVCAGVLLPACV